MHAPNDKSTTKKKPSRAYRDLKRSASAIADFADPGALFWDTGVHGLRLRVGKYRATWSYFKEHSIHGKRSATCKTLGHYPSMGIDAARAAALVVAGQIADKRIEPGKRAALRLRVAMDSYIAYLRKEVERKNEIARKQASKADRPHIDKPARHAANVAKLRRQFFAEFENWPLRDLANTPAVVKDWHEKMTRDAGPVSANRAAEVLRACYRYAYKLDIHLPQRVPTAAIEFNIEKREEVGDAMTRRNFPAWAAAWSKIESPIHRSFALVNLLTGCRPGELARLQRADVLPRERVFVIRNAKASADIRVILSVPIIRALRIALAAHSGADVFPGCAQAAHRLPLPARGVELRRTYRTIAADLGVDEMLAHFLMGHAPEGISQRYVSRMMLAAGPAMRRAQGDISREIVRLLGID